MTAMGNRLNDELIQALYANSKKTTPEQSSTTLSLRNRRDTVNQALEPIDYGHLSFDEPTDDDYIENDIENSVEVDNHDEYAAIDEDNYEDDDDNYEVEEGEDDYAEDISSYDTSDDIVKNDELDEINQDNSDYLDPVVDEYIEDVDYTNVDDTPADESSTTEDESESDSDDTSEQETEENLLNVTEVSGHHFQSTYQDRAGTLHKRDSIVLYKEKCLRCSHLCSGLTDGKLFTSCHFSNGNIDCPANFMRIIPNGVNTQAAATGLAEAQHLGDIVRQHKITGRLLDLDPILVKHIIQLATEKRYSLQNSQ